MALKVVHDGEAPGALRENCFRETVDADRAARAPADSVLEDAARYRWLRLALADRTNNGKSHWFCSIAAGRPEELDAAIDAARAAQEPTHTPPPAAPSSVQPLKLEGANHD